MDSLFNSQKCNHSIQQPDLRDHIEVKAPPRLASSISSRTIQEASRNSDRVLQSQMTFQQPCNTAAQGNTLESQQNTQQQKDKRQKFSPTELKQSDSDLKVIMFECPPCISCHIGAEVFILACQVIKYNKYGWRNNRFVTLTRDSIFFFKSKSKATKELRRRIAIDDLSGLTLSLNPNSTEMVIHVHNEGDARLTCGQNRKELSDSLKLMYVARRKQSLPIFGVRQKNLSIYTTSEYDLAKGILRMPLSLARLNEEDFINLDSLIQRGQPEHVTSKEAEEQQSVIFQSVCGETANPTTNLTKTNTKMDVDDGSPQVLIMEDESDQFHADLIEMRLARNQTGDGQDQPWIDDPTNDPEEAQQLFSRSSELEKVVLEDFEMIKKIGQGSFGKVFLIYQETHRQFHALKSMRKDVILDMNSLQSVNLERLILLQVNHPFIVKMHYVFQTKHRVYFVMDYVPGGEFFSYMQQIRQFKQSQVAFYAAQIALALGYLHSSDIIYRDLKPENILLDQQGYIVLSDFGLAKQAKESNTFCGTPEYMPPEMLLATGHDHTVDWWALGILIYEMLTGVPPFYDKNRNKMFLNIEKAQLRWPDPEVHKITVSPEAKDLISKLLVKDRMQRLGQQNDAAEILNHQFFSSIALDKLFNKELTAPIVPQTVDPQELRQSVQQVIKLRNLQETCIPQENQEILNVVNSAAFGQFGTDIDKTTYESVSMRAETFKNEANAVNQRRSDNPTDLIEEDKDHSRQSYTHSQL